MTPQEFREKRRAADLTIDQLARYLGLTNGQVRSIERGTRTPTIQDLSILHKLHEAKGQTPHTPVKQEHQNSSQNDGGLYFHSSENTQRPDSKRRFNSYGFSIVRGSADGLAEDAGQNEEI